MNTLETKSMLAFAASVMSLAANATVPTVTSCTMEQPSNARAVTITYTLDNAPAVVTLDVQTNRTGAATASEADWISIGGEAVSNAKGDVWKKVGTSGTFNGTITWRPDQSWPGHKIENNSARAVVTAWSLDNTPDYMVVDISAAAQQNTQNYYPAVEFLPGGLLGNPDYRTTSLVMRKIMAKDVKWTMGSTTMEPNRNASREATHKVTLTNNYYIGVFPVTQTQWSLVASNSGAKGYFTTEPSMRPMESISFNELRNTHSATPGKDVTVAVGSGGVWPDAPTSDSFLGLLRLKSGITLNKLLN